MPEGSNKQAFFSKSRTSQVPRLANGAAAEEWSRIGLLAAWGFSAVADHGRRTSTSSRTVVLKARGIRDILGSPFSRVPGAVAGRIDEENHTTLHAECARRRVKDERVYGSGGPEDPPTLAPGLSRMGAERPGQACPRVA